MQHSMQLQICKALMRLSKLRVTSKWHADFKKRKRS